MEAKEVTPGHQKEENKINGVELQFPYMDYTWPQSNKAVKEHVFYREFSLFTNVFSESVNFILKKK